MKATCLILAAALGLALAGTVAAQNQNQGPRHRGHPGAALRARLLERFDTDGDGKLSEAERAAAKAQFPELSQAIIAMLDTDGDGKVSEAEKAAARERMQARIQEVIAKYDADGDGRLNEQERRAAFDAFMAGRL